MTYAEQLKLLGIWGRKHICLLSIPSLTVSLNQLLWGWGKPTHVGKLPKKREWHVTSPCRTEPRDINSRGRGSGEESLSGKSSMETTLSRLSFFISGTLSPSLKSSNTYRDSWRGRLRKQHFPYFFLPQAVLQNKGWNRLREVKRRLCLLGIIWLS